MLLPYRIAMRGTSTGFIGWLCRHLHNVTYRLLLYYVLYSMSFFF